MLCALVVSFLGPTIWIVDAAGGPGTHFTDLPPAIAAAQDGDTILVRAGMRHAASSRRQHVVVERQLVGWRPRRDGHDRFAPGCDCVVGLAVLRGGVGYSGTQPGHGGAAVWAAGGSAVVHGGVTLLPALAAAPLTSGAVTMSPVTMPRLTVQSTTLASGETHAVQPLTMTFDAQLPNAPYAFIVGFVPDFATPFGSLVLGPLLVDPGSAALATGTLDAQGRFSFSIVPAGVLGSALGIPFFSQAAAFDAATLQFWASNVDARIFAQ